MRDGKKPELGVRTHLARSWWPSASERTFEREEVLWKNLQDSCPTRHMA